VDARARALGLLCSGVDAAAGTPAARSRCRAPLALGERGREPRSTTRSRSARRPPRARPRRVRPLGIEADRAGKPVDPGHPFMRCCWLGLDARWLGESAGKERAGAGPALTGVLLSEEMAYWDRGVAVSFRVPDSANTRALDGHAGGRTLPRAVPRPDRPRAGARSR
jgi:hypothetical protein